MLSQRFNIYNRKNEPSRRWRTCLCWLMCIFVWRGPIPIIHDHSLNSESLGNNTQLAAHVLEFHLDHLGEESSGLHLHFVVLEECAVCPALPSHTAGSHDGGATFGNSQPLAFGQERSQPNQMLLEFQISEVEIHIGDSLLVFEDLRFSSTANEKFLQTQLIGTSASALLCVFLC